MSQPETIAIPFVLAAQLHDFLGAIALPFDGIGEQRASLVRLLRATIIAQQNAQAAGEPAPPPLPPEIETIRRRSQPEAPVAA